MSENKPFAEPFTCSMVKKTVTISGLEVTLSGSPGPLYCEQHVSEERGGFIRTVADWSRNIKPESWMSQGYRIEPAPQDGPEQKESVDASLTAQSQLPGHS
jgi:hypothetical protein